MKSNFSPLKPIKKQFKWTERIKGEVWQKIVFEKISKQRDFLHELDMQEEANLLSTYLSELQFNDMTNREGHAAKVYFNAVFGMQFARRTETFTNRALNYGYSIILSAFNREVVKNGYLLPLGIWHKNEFNYFNLASDFMEPFRILIDRIVFDLKDGDDYKYKLLSVFDYKLKIDNKVQVLENAITVYVRSLFDALNEQDASLIKFYEL